MAVDAMRELYDLVIIDGPALLVRSDALVLADLADGVLFVVRAGITPLSQVNQALDQIEERKLRGVVLNGTYSSVPGWLRRLCGLA
jgi:Mrp family chromosome partitioning ATPase